MAALLVKRSKRLKKEPLSSVQPPPSHLHLRRHSLSGPRKTTGLTAGSSESSLNIQPQEPCMIHILIMILCNLILAVHAVKQEAQKEVIRFTEEE